MKRLLLCTFWLLSFSCSEERVVKRTQLVLVADTDIRDLERVEFSVDGTARDPETFESPLREDGEPLSLTLLYEEGPLNPVFVSAAGYRDGEKIIERSAVVSFVLHKTLMVPLHLVESCRGTSCLSSESCTEQGCAALVQPPEALPRWNGKAPRLPVSTMEEDSGMGPEPMDAGEAEDANVELDASSEEAGESDAALADAEVDAAAEVDAGPEMTCGDAGLVNTSSDENHCGECFNVCTSLSLNAVPLCQEGVCREACRAHYGNCDKLAATGCEVYLGTTMNCGACGTPCKKGEKCEPWTWGAYSGAFCTSSQ